MVHINSNHPIKLKINSEYLITGNFCPHNFRFCDFIESQKSSCYEKESCFSSGNRTLKWILPIYEKQAWQIIVSQTLWG